MQPPINAPRHRPGWVAGRLGAMLGVGLGYYALGLVGTLVSVPPSGFAIIWPATAFLVGALLLTPWRDWGLYPLVLVAAHALLTTQAQPHAPLAVAAAQVGGNVALAVATVLVLQRVSRGQVRFDTFRGALTLILVAGLAVPAVVNALILVLHVMSGWTRDFWLSWRQWMLASIFPTITITPLMSALAGRHRTDRRRILEIAVLSVALFVLTFEAFGVESPYAPTLLLTPLPIILWAALRWGVGGVSLSLLIFAGAIIAQALRGAGPFAASAYSIGVLSLQVYLTALSAPLILLAALMEDRRRGELALRRSESRMEIAAASTDTGLWQWDVGAQDLWMTPHCRAMFAAPPDTGQGLAVFLDAVHPDDSPRVRMALKDALTTSNRALREFRILRPNGEERWFIMRTHADLDAHGEAIRVSGVFRDITPQVAAQRESEQLSRRLLTLQEDERKNIAEALHDSTTQHLVASELVLGMMERRTPPGGDLRELLDDIRGSIREAIRELRAFTYLLRPPELEQQGLREVLRKYVVGFGLRTGLEAKSELTAEVDLLPIEQQRALFRIAQESLANAYRHASATRVTVDLRREADELHLIISDDGQGIEPAPPQGEAVSVRLGVGIPGMTARVRQLGGKIDIRSSPSGTTVHVVLAMGGAGRGPGAGGPLERAPG